ncbi:MAG: hypothetical protein H7834_14795 [Magnetococcus sp. YQC-9]
MCDKWIIDAFEHEHDRPQARWSPVEFDRRGVEGLQEVLAVIGESLDLAMSAADAAVAEAESKAPSVPKPQLHAVTLQLEK